MPPAGPPAGAKGDWDWLLAVAQAPARPYSPPAGLANGLVVGGRYLFKGIAANNTATAAGLITVIDGTDSTGVPVFYLPVGASTANNSPFLGDGILCEIGIYITVTGAAGKVTIWAAALHDYPFTPPGELSAVATEIRHFTAVIPAGTPQAAPVVRDTSFPPNVVLTIDWRVPHGPVGLMGWRLTMGGVQVIPTFGDKWVVADGQSGTFRPSPDLSSGAWQLTGYNTGAQPHSVYLAFHLDPTSPKPEPVRLVPAWMLGNAPDLAGLLLPGLQPP